MLGQIILQIVLIALSAALTCAETSVVATSDSRIEKLAASGKRQAVRLKRLTAKPGRLLSTMRIASAAAGFMAAAFAAVSFSAALAAAAEKAAPGIPYAALRVAAIVVITLILSFFMLVFGELIPKRAAAKNAEKIALAMSGFISFVSGLFAPVAWLHNAVANGILRIFGIDPESDSDTVTEEEILMMSDAGAEKGTIDEDENRIIKNVFAFDDMTAGQVCTHRTDVDVLWSEDAPEVWEETIHRTRHSVFPICGESVDNVIGVLNAKNYFRLDDKSRENIMANAVREPCFVHETMKADRLFDQMKQRGADHFAVVVDEYGGMSGIITITDLVEELVGDFDEDPHDQPTARLEQLSENTWTVPGISSLSDVCEELDVTLPADKYETFGGYVIAELGEIPKDGTQLELEAGGLHIKVMEVKHHRIEVCIVEKPAPPEDDSAA